eukprot:gene6636-biopygen1766
MRGVGIVGNAARIKTVIAAPHGTVCRDRSRSRRCGAARCGVAAARGARSQRPVGQVAGHTAAAAVAPGGRRCARGYASVVVPTVAPWLRAVRAPSPGLDLHQVADQYSRRGKILEGIWGLTFRLPEFNLNELRVRAFPGVPDSFQGAQANARATPAPRLTLRP